MDFLSTFSADIVHQETLKSEHQGKAYYNHRQGNAIGNERPESELDRKSQIQSRDKDEEKAEHGHHRTVGMTVYNRPYLLAAASGTKRSHLCPFLQHGANKRSGLVVVFLEYIDGYPCQRAVRSSSGVLAFIMTVRSNTVRPKQILHLVRINAVLTFQ